VSALEHVADRSDGDGARVACGERNSAANAANGRSSLKLDDLVGDQRQAGERGVGAVSPRR